MMALKILSSSLPLLSQHTHVLPRVRWHPQQQREQEEEEQVASLHQGLLSELPTAVASVGVVVLAVVAVVVVVVGVSNVFVS